jgi:hypothetical protein
MSRTCRRTGAVSAIAATALALVATLTACNGPSGARVASARDGGRPAASPSVDPVRLAQQYVACMRRQGVPMLDRLTDEGRPQVDKTKVDPDRLGPAMERCRSLLPPVEATRRPAAQDVERMRAYATCLRAHGLAEYPDPDPDTGEPAMSEALAQRIKDDPHLDAAMRACASLTPSSGAGVVGG